MKKFSKKREEEHVAIADKLQKALTKLQEEVAKYNNEICDLNEKAKTAFDAVDDAASAFNEAVGEANTFSEEVVNEINDYAEERSDAWKDSEKGQQYDTWRAAWEDDEIEEVSIESPNEFEEIEVEEDEIVEQFLGRPSSPDEA